MALFVIDDNNFIKKQILEKKPDQFSKRCTEETILLFQNHLKNINNSINGTDTYIKTACNIRKDLKKCKLYGHEFYTKKQNDSHEFIQFLFEIFDITTLTSTLTVEGSNDKNRWYFRKEEQFLRPPIWSLKTDKNKDLDLNKSLTQVTVQDSPEWVYKFKRETVTISTEIPYLVLHINRNETNNDGKRVKNKRQVIISPRLDALNVDLKAIILHSGNQNSGHYTMVFEQDGMWYTYNDLKKQQPISTKPMTFEEMQKTSARNVTMCIYTNSSSETV